MGVEARPEKGGEIGVDHTTVLKNVSLTKKIAGSDVRAKDRAAAAGSRDLGPLLHENGPYTVVTSRQGDRVAIYNRWTGDTKTVRFPVPKDVRHRIAPEWAADNVTLALHVWGPAVSRIAVYVSGTNPGWYPQDLREPVVEARPVVGAQSVVYTAGRYVYGFTYREKRWVVLELPEGSHPTVKPDDDLQSFSVASGRHLYYLNLNKNQWDDVDLDAILDVPPAEPGTDTANPGLQ